MSIKIKLLAVVGLVRIEKVLSRALADKFIWNEFEQLNENETAA